MDLSNKNLRIERAKKHVHKPGYKFPVEKRIEVATKWLALGNMRLVSELTGVSYQLCRMWKAESWWPELIEEIKASKTRQLDDKLSRIVDMSLDAVADRLQNGDVIFNQKTGTIERKEVSLKDATKVATDLLTRQAVINKQEQEQVVHKDATSIKDQLAMLALEFAKFNKTNTGPVEDAKLIQESVNDISLAQSSQRGTSMGDGDREETSGDFEKLDTAIDGGANSDGDFLFDEESGILEETFDNIKE